MVDQERFNTQWPRPRSYQVVGFGNNAVDWIVRLPEHPRQNTSIPIESMQQLGGGQVATACALCARYGLSVHYIGRVGDDEIGRFSQTNLASESMNLSLESIAGATSQYAIILVDQLTGDRTILWNKHPSLSYRAEDVPMESIQQGQLLHLDGHDQPAAVQAARVARQAGMKVCLDINKVQPGVEKLVELVDFLIPSENFIRAFSGADDWQSGLLWTARQTEGIVIVTLGVQGCGICWKGEVHQIPTYPVQPVDTTGAGDVFHGAFIYSLFQEWSVAECLRFANAAGALSTTAPGARGGIPELERARALAGIGK